MCRNILGFTILMAACQYGPEDFPAPGLGQEAVVIEVSAPVTPALKGESLYQLLYEDEYGTGSQAVGQRARMLAWLVTMELEADQLIGLHTLCKEVAEKRREEEADRMRVGQLEQQHLNPIYAELNDIFAKGVVPEKEAADAMALRLEEARQKIHDRGPSPTRSDEGEGPPGEVKHLQRQRRRTADVVAYITKWVATLNPTQVQSLSSARYFLRRRAGPLVNPGYYQWVVGSQWDLGDFDLLRHSESTEKVRGMDLAGLWQLEDHRAKSDVRLTLFQAAAIMALAVTEPGLQGAIEVIQGTRAPDDFSVSTR